MGISNQIIQNGNTTLGWELSGGDTSIHDVIVPQLDNGTSGVKMSNVVLRINPNRYAFDLTVVGAGGVAWRGATSRVG